ncbi:hypothetical protein [Acinetobacter courvalinii]|uniref:hypothetical protein n=1 Tax=Acinetobacter courvalinii TaxID=280147 RepID=UPI0002CE3A23|nr:hypothetical protein [Acinetobacter courvalinii]ENX08267.1 hypothetical protein F898_01264 [Acinetobacter courvalinii]
MAKSLSLTLCIASIVFITLSSQAMAFDVYQFINWRFYKNDKGEVIRTKDTEEFQQYLATLKIKKMNVIYPQKILTNNKADPKKIKIIAEDSRKNPNIPICFDIEIGEASKPETNLPVILDALKLYKKYGGVAPIGVYGVLPQKSPNKILNKSGKIQISSLNNKYEEIAQNVDFLAPTLYFYDLKDINIWNDKAKFNMSEAKRYSKKYNIKIIPFVSLSTWENVNGRFKINPLTEHEMSIVIQNLKLLGANGVVIWESGAAVQDDNRKSAIFDINHSSYKAIVNIANRQ